MSSITSLFLLDTIWQTILLVMLTHYFMKIVSMIVLFVQHVSVAQVRNVITSLKDSSPGWDHLSPFVMKQCVDTYVEPITVLINNSFYHGIFPDELKLARVVPIFKSGDSSNINNY